MESNFNWGLPPDISAHGAQIDHLFNLLHVFMVVLFVGWGIFLVYCLIKFRERPGHVADISTKHFTLPKYLEVGVLLFEVFLLVGVSSPIWFSVKKDFPAEKDATVVHIWAKQFSWNIHYPGRDGKFGPIKNELIDGTNPIGLDRENPDGKDDIITINNLNIPVEKPVIVHLHSQDVIHSFFLPYARVKQDAIPGMEIPLWFKVEKTGNYDIACAQLCGVLHSTMRGMFNVMTAEEFKTWMDEEEKALVSQNDTAEDTKLASASQKAAQGGSDL